MAKTCICGKTATSYSCLVKCYERGAKLRFNVSLGFCTSIHNCIYGFKVCQKGVILLQCHTPATNPADIYPGKPLAWHQHRVPKSILNNFAQKMLSLKLNSKTFSDFEDLFDYVASNCGLANKGRCLLTYDFCLRYGHCIGIRPKDFVYLFNGAHAGAKSLLGTRISYRMPYSTFTKLLGPSLDAAEVEDFLCVCKGTIPYVTKHHSIASPSPIGTTKSTKTTTKP